MGNTAKIFIECDEFGNLMVSSNLALKGQILEVMTLAFNKVRKDKIDLRKINGQEEPHFARSLSRN